MLEGKKEKRRLQTNSSLCEWKRKSNNKFIFWFHHDFADMDSHIRLETALKFKDFPTFYNHRLDLGPT